MRNSNIYTIDACFKERMMVFEVNPQC